LENIKHEGGTYKKLIDELNIATLRIPKLEYNGNDLVAPHSEFFPQGFNSPNSAPQAAEEPLPPRYPRKQESSFGNLPTPNQSPQNAYNGGKSFYPNAKGFSSPCSYGFNAPYYGYSNQSTFGLQKKAKE
jgi:hypothetical protein